MITRQFFQSDDDLDPFMLSEDFDDQNHGFQEPEENESPQLVSDLISLQETSLSAYLAWYWHSTHFINRLAWWGIKHQPEISSELLENNPATRLFWLKGEGIPLEARSKIRWAYKIKNFIDSAGFIISDVGTIALAFLLLHDWMSYGLFSDERCGTFLPDIFAGTATNQITWTHHFGSDVIHEAAYWTWLGAILVPPIVGLSSNFLHNKHLRALETQSVMDNITVTLANLDKESLTFKDACLSWFPMSRLSRTLTQVKFMLLWDGRKDNAKNLLISMNFKVALVNNLIELAESNYFLIRYRAMQLLAQIAASFHPENLDRFIDDPAHKTGLVQLRETILAKLRKEPMSEASTRRALVELEEACAQPLSFEERENDGLLQDRQRGGMARYFRWILGDDVRPATQLFWIPSLLISTFTFYSIGRYLELIVKKLIDITYHFSDKSACENKGNYFKFLIQNERYECVACDWFFVNYQNSWTAQSCLEGLLQLKMKPMELGRYLNQLPSVRGITRVDFSQQDWSDWPVSEWEKLLIALETRIISPLELFNVSGIVTEDNENRTPSLEHIQVLGQLLAQINVTQFDMSHQRLTDELFPILLDPLASQSLNALYLTDTNMTDTSASYLSELVANHWSNLTDLHLTSNQIGDKGITQISLALPNSSLQILNVAHNLFSDLGLQKLGLGIQKSFVQSLDLSAQSFSINGLNLFSDALTGNSSLSRLKLSNAGLMGEHLNALQSCLGNLEVLDVSNNLLANTAIPFLLKQASQSGLKALNIAKNRFGEDIDQLLAKDLPATSLEYLDLSKNYFSEGLTHIAKALPDSQLLSLVCEDCELDDQDVAELTSTFSNTSLLLQSLNLNNNEITNQTLINWLEVLPQTSLRELHLNKNEISNSNESASLLAQGLTKTNLTILDLSSNRLDRNFFNELAPLLIQSPLQQLSLSNNKLETGSLKHFSEALVQLPCHRQDLNAPHLSRQEKRIFYPMKRNTQLNQLDMVNTDPDSSTLRGFCRVAASLPNIRFLEPDRISQLDWQTCELLPANSRPASHLEQTPVSSNQTQSMRSTALVLGSPFLMSLLCAGGILCVIALFYGAYRASRSTYRFFRPAPPTVRSEFEENITNSNLRRFPI